MCCRMGKRGRQGNCLGNKSKRSIANYTQYCTSIYNGIFLDSTVTTVTISWLINFNVKWAFFLLETSTS